MRVHRAQAVRNTALAGQPVAALTRRRAQIDLGSCVLSFKATAPPTGDGLGGCCALAHDSVGDDRTQELVRLLFGYIYPVEKCHSIRTEFTQGGVRSLQSVLFDNRWRERVRAVYECELVRRHDGFPG